MYVSQLHRYWIFKCVGGFYFTQCTPITPISTVSAKLYILLKNHLHIWETKQKTKCVFSRYDCILTKVHHPNEYGGFLATVMYIQLPIASPGKSQLTRVLQSYLFGGSLKYTVIQCIKWLFWFFIACL